MKRVREREREVVGVNREFVCYTIFQRLVFRRARYRHQDAT